MGFLSALFAITSATVALAAAIYLHFKWSFQYWKKKNVPYLEPTIPFGTVSNTYKEKLSDKFVEAYKIAKSRGWKYCGMYMMSTPVLLLVDQDVMKRVLSTDFQYFIGRGIYTNEKADPVGCHLFAMTGPKWKSLRTKLTQNFSSNKIKLSFQAILDCGIKLEKYLEENMKPEQPVNVFQIVSCFTMDWTVSCGYGLDAKSFEQPCSLFKRLRRNIANVNVPRALKIMFTQNHPSLGRLLGMGQVPSDVAKQFTDIVKEQVAYRKRNNVIGRDFLQFLVDLRTAEEENKENDSGLSMEVMISQCYGYFIAGHETTSAAMTSALYELAVHPEIQDRLRNEIRMVLAEHGDNFTYEALSEMKYLAQVVDEILRLRSPANVIQRICTKDYPIPGEDVIIEKGTRLYISIPSVHADEDYWKNPEQFDPDRFTEEKKRSISQYSYVPFGHGPRKCIAQRFSLVGVKLGLACFIRKFRITLNLKTKLPLKMSPKCLFPQIDGGVWLNFEKL